MKTSKTFKLLTLFSILILISCGSDGDGDNEKISDPDQVARLMNDNLILPPGHFIVNPDDVEVDESITIINTANSTIPIDSGQSMSNPITFNAPNGNVNAVGMRFGTSGPIYFVPIETNGANSGTGVFDFLITQGICDDLSEICHDIRCYEFAQTTSGQISAANITDVAMLCGNCDEPSCEGLVDTSECISGEDGDPRFNLTWSGSTDLDLYVTDPTGETISYINISSSSGGILDVDCVGDCDTVNSENITWPDGGPSGTYSFYANHFSGGSTSFSILVRDNGVNVTTYSGTLSSDNNSTVWTYIKN